MLSRKASVFLISCLFMGLASVASAGIPDMDNSSATTTLAEDVSVLICPLGDGDPMTAARVFGSGTTDATITVTLLDINYVPVVAYPKEDIWFEANGLCYCTDGTIADADTDAAGQTTLTGPFDASGCSNDFSTEIHVGTDVLNQPGLAHLQYNSPDMNCDFVVNLSDIVLFAGILYGTYDYCADFYWDGIVNLSDIVVWAQHNGHACP